MPIFAHRHVCGQHINLLYLSSFLDTLDKQVHVFINNLLIRLLLGLFVYVHVSL